MRVNLRESIDVAADLSVKVICWLLLSYLEHSYANVCILMSSLSSCFGDAAMMLILSAGFVWDSSLRPNYFIY